jgi:hypothetical protein
LLFDAAISASPCNFMNVFANCNIICSLGCFLLPAQSHLNALFLLFNIYTIF